MTSKPIRIPLIGLEVERKTDLLAFAAFLLAFMAVFIQSCHYYVGAKVTFFAPEQVTLLLELNPANHKPYLRIAARMAYANTGWVNYNATVRREQVEFSFGGGEDYLQLWHSEEQTTSDNSGKLLRKYLAEAGPFPIVAGGSVSREVYFASFPERCRNAPSNCDENRQFITADHAIELIKTHNVMELKFKSYLLGEIEPRIAKCEADIGPDTALVLIRMKWVSLRCFLFSDSSDDSPLFIIPLL